MEFFSCQKSDVYRCYAYGRLSKKDKEEARQKKDESNSIKNQRDLLHEYIGRHPELELCMEGYDDNYTGTNFNRPHFQEMMQAIEDGKINCIVVKDLSRFGRERIDTDRYLFRKFPSKNIRFIAILDNVDSISWGSSDHLLVSVKNLFNDNYCRDTSIKIRSHLDIRRRNGKFIGSFAAYGYRKDPEDKNHLVIDDEAACVVRDIFAWKIDGMSNQGIADRLNRLGILSPMEYKQAKGVKYGSGYKVHSKAAWSAVTVKRILTSPVYLGIMEQAKRTTPNYKIKQEIQRPPEEWIRVEDTHDPIVSQGDFDLVARLLMLDTRTAPGETYVYSLAGLLYCGDCHSSMVRKKMPNERDSYPCYICSGHKGDSHVCSTHNIRTDDLERAVLFILNFHIQSVGELRQSLEAIRRRPEQKLEVSKLNRRMDALYQELEAAQENKDALYRRYASGDVDLEDFQYYKRVFSKDCQKVEAAIAAQRAQLDAILESGSPDSPWITYFQQFGQVDKLSRGVAVKLIDRVYVYEDGRVDIEFRYQEEYEMALEFQSLHKQDGTWKEAV